MHPRAEDEFSKRSIMCGEGDLKVEGGRERGAMAGEVGMCKIQRQANTQHKGSQRQCQTRMQTSFVSTRSRLQFFSFTSCCLCMFCALPPSPALLHDSAALSLPTVMGTAADTARHHSATPATSHAYHRSSHDLMLPVSAWSLCSADRN